MFVQSVALLVSGFIELNLKRKYFDDDTHLYL